VGFVPFEDLIGRAQFVFLSIGGRASAWEVWRWPQVVRWSRLFTPLR
jgi:signal peptidase I